MIAHTGSTAPYVGDIIEAGFGKAQAFVVLLSPDETATLRPELQCTDNDRVAMFQPRPNVLLEAGMALAYDSRRTIVVEISPMREVSDILGRHVIKFSGTATDRHALANRLKIAGCEPDLTGADWLKVGKFTTTGKLVQERKKS
jgi:predicted nucleotide-binding protein